MFVCLSVRKEEEKGIDNFIQAHGAPGKIKPKATDFLVKSKITDKLFIIICSTSDQT